MRGTLAGQGGREPSASDAKSPDARGRWVSRSFATPWGVRPFSALWGRLVLYSCASLRRGFGFEWGNDHGADVGGRWSRPATHRLNQQRAANVAGYYEIPLATLQWFRVRADGQLPPYYRRR
jgi:hypothetical protein